MKAGIQVAEPDPRLKHRPSRTGNDIAAKRISCKPQKLQEICAIVRIGRGSRRKVEHASRKKRLEQALDGSGSAGVYRLGAEDEQYQAGWSERAGSD
jgi:hypothetical protein